MTRPWSIYSAIVFRLSQGNHLENNSAVVAQVDQDYPSLMGTVKIKMNKFKMIKYIIVLSILNIPRPRPRPFPWEPLACEEMLSKDKADDAQGSSETENFAAILGPGILLGAVANPNFQIQMDTATWHKTIEYLVFLARHPILVDFSSVWAQFLIPGLHYLTFKAIFQ